MWQDIFKKVRLESCLGDETMTQISVNETYTSTFENGWIPELLYISNVDEAYTKFPRSMHKHNDILELIYIKKGNGHFIIGDRHYRVHQGDVLIYNKGVLHDEYPNPKTNLNVFCCGITNVKFAGLPKNHLVSPESSYVLHSGDQAIEIETMLNIMYSQVSNEKTGRAEICSYLLRSLIPLLLQIPQNNFGQSPSEESILSKEIKAYVDEYYFEKINLEYIARKFHISSYYLSHLFKEFTGFSLIQYTIRRRIGEAQSLLINTNDKVTRIAGTVGYDNTSYFTTLFSKIVGMSPKKYREFWRKQ
ncbi:AraC-type DNA-binding protein [Halobacillus karajensis]|uniref:AraC family transcriptional regulator n=1 Tax=Halobacillus karajensis TaxID=195088 RepID=UPI0008A73032|nr:AraC family transcriptional regulator [Halobacillus karajensis]SEH83402.1 AraC-type DNA-binding protein [Halobacillus karajensis]